MPLSEHPASLSKSRLKSDLVAHGVALPPAKSKKEVYVQLHLKHVDQKTSAGLSGDEEALAQDVTENPEEAEMPDVTALTDDDLKATLHKYGFKAGPIVASTRAVHEKKLRRLLQSDRQVRFSGAEKEVLYSDRKEEEENGQDDDDADSDSEKQQKTLEESYQTQQKSNQNDDFVYPQCFLPSSRLHIPTCRSMNPGFKWNSGKVVKSSEQSQSRCSQIPVGITKSSSADQCSGLRSVVPSGSPSVTANGCSSFSSQAFSITQMVEEMECRKSFSPITNTERKSYGSNVQERCSRFNRLPQEPMKGTFKDIFPDTEAIQRRTYATCRKPIKGTAGRPVQRAYADTPASPTTIERREVERHLVPIHIQILVFFIVTFLLYLINVCVEDNSLSPLVAFLDSLTQGVDGDERALIQSNTQDTPVFSRQV